MSCQFEHGCRMAKWANLWHALPMLQVPFFLLLGAGALYCLTEHPAAIGYIVFTVLAWRAVQG